MDLTVPSRYEPRTIKQRKWAKALIETGSPTEAARIAYPGTTEITIRTIASENSKKLDITAVFDKAGLTDYWIADTLYGAMSATRDNGKPDWLPRLKASEMALKVRGHFKERIEHMGAIGVYPILGGLSKGKDVIEGVEVVDKVDK